MARKNQNNSTVNNDNPVTELEAHINAEIASMPVLPDSDNGDNELANNIMQENTIDYASIVEHDIDETMQKKLEKIKASAKIALSIVNLRHNDKKSVNASFFRSFAQIGDFKDNQEIITISANKYESLEPHTIGKTDYGQFAYIDGLFVPLAKNKELNLYTLVPESAWNDYAYTGMQLFGNCEPEFGYLAGSEIKPSYSYIRQTTSDIKQGLQLVKNGVITLGELSLCSWFDLPLYKRIVWQSEQGKANANRANQRKADILAEIKAKRIN